ncbi:hypothetical protein TESG_07702 [Trichophyton tonsurans CBS 112818]|uniref:Uncharacterized protein n=2 Tax=Trichophyton TaxID=5550 RepID=F2Q3N1_TRIEC|nr:hypothetical protein TESG_07702 [Trichophyton tonsurans CBS 112818]EGE08749.1 hypothetical protein TEQG_07706 [Trichophyton equinum CBS 127.97]
MQTAEPFLPVLRLRLRLRLREGVVEGPVKLVNKLVGKAQSKLPRKRKGAQAIKSPPVGVQIQYYFSRQGTGFYRTRIIPKQLDARPERIDEIVRGMSDTRWNTNV